MFPEVWTGVVCGVYTASPAVLAGYARYAVQDKTYPGMVLADDPRAAVEGVVYFDLDAADLQALDVFEGDDYRRVQVALRLTDDTTITAWTYVYLPTWRLSNQSWLPEHFKLQRFLESYCKEKLG